MKPYSKYLFTLFLVISSLASSYAQFSDSYAPANWTLLTPNPSNGSANTVSAPTSITIMGSDGVNAANVVTDYTISSIATGTWSFDWSYHTNDEPSYDPAGVLINGVFTKLTNDLGAVDQSGTYNGASVNEGIIIGFRINSTDNEFGAATFTISNYSPPDGVLPVELTSFTAQLINNEVRLNWQTATELGNYGFEILRTAQNDNSWEQIGFVNGHGNSNSVKEYSFLDEDVSAGKYSYRLKQIDHDGAFEYSKTVEIDYNNAPAQFSLEQNYPNPFNPSTIIRFSILESSNVKLTLYNMLGQEITTLVNEIKEPGIHLVNFDGSEMNSGIYIYKIESGNTVQSRKMTLLK